MHFDWRSQFLQAVQEALERERETLKVELQSRSSGPDPVDYSFLWERLEKVVREQVSSSPAPVPFQPRRRALAEAVECVCFHSWALASTPASSLSSKWKHRACRSPGTPASRAAQHSVRGARGHGHCRAPEPVGTAAPDSQGVLRMRGHFLPRPRAVEVLGPCTCHTPGVRSPSEQRWRPRLEGWLQGGTVPPSPAPASPVPHTRSPFSHRETCRKRLSSTSAYRTGAACCLRSRPCVPSCG